MVFITATQLCCSSAKFSSVAQLCLTLQSCGLRHVRPPCPSPTPGVYPNPCSSSRWWHPAISSFVVPFSSCPQSLPASGSFPVSQLLASGGQSIGVSASASVLPMNTQDWFPLGWTGWISLQSKGLSRVLSNTHSSKASILRCSAFFIVQLSHPYMTTGKTIASTRQTFVGIVMSLVFNMLSKLVITFLPRSKHLLISWLHSPSAVILEPQKIICRLSPAKAELPGIQQKEEKMGYPFLFNFLGVSLPFKPETTSSVKYCLIDLLWILSPWAC